MLFYREIERTSKAERLACPNAHPLLTLLYTMFNRSQTRNPVSGLQLLNHLLHSVSTWWLRTTLSLLNISSGSSAVRLASIVSFGSSFRNCFPQLVFFLVFRTRFLRIHCSSSVVALYRSLLRLPITLPSSMSRSRRTWLSYLRFRCLI